MSLMASALLSLSHLAAPYEPAQGTRIAEARQALDHWSRHASELPWRRRAARREARMRIATARAQLIGAHLERWGLGAVERLLSPLLDTRGRSRGAHVRSLAFTSLRRTALGRRILLGAAGLAAAWLAVLGIVILIAIHVVGLS
jgi:hypothetical protein